MKLNKVKNMWRTLSVIALLGSTLCTSCISEDINRNPLLPTKEDEKMEQIQRLRTEKNQAFQPVKKDADNLQTVVSAVEESGDVMHLSQNVVETFIDRIEVFNDERVKIHFTFEDTLNSYEEK